MAKYKKKKIKVVLVGGVFDILHYGHIYFLKKAKNLGGYLIVALESDRNVKRLKGNKRPIHNQMQRKETLESLKFVDQVIILKDKMTDNDYRNLVMKLKPNIIAVTKGDMMISKKRKYSDSVGASLIEVPLLKTYSTTKIAKLLKIE